MQPFPYPNLIYPKTLCSLSPILMMLHIKFDQDWPTGLRDIQISSEKLWQNDRIQKDKANPVTRWVGIKESGRPKPALLDSGSPCTGLLSSGIVYTIEGTNGTLMQIWISI